MIGATAKYPDDLLTFEIVGISQERRLDGKTTIQARCVQDSLLLTVEVPSDKVALWGPGFVRSALLKEYRDITQLRNHPSVKVGDTI